LQRSFFIWLSTGKENLSLRDGAMPGSMALPVRDQAPLTPNSPVIFLDKIRLTYASG
jgi:hypothetical protein